MVWIWILGISTAYCGVMRLDDSLQALVYENLHQDKYHDYTCQRPSPRDIIQRAPYNKCVRKHKNYYLSSVSELITNSRAEEVSQDFLTQWFLYTTTAMGKDSLLPLSGKGEDDKGGISHALASNLDTVYFMGSDLLFEDAMNYTIENPVITGTKIKTAPFIKDVIGGILSSYFISQNEELLELAIKLSEEIPYIFSYFKEQHFPYPEYFVNNRTGIRPTEDHVYTIDAYGLEEVVKIYQLTNNQELKAIIDAWKDFLNRKGKGLNVIPAYINTLEFKRAQKRFQGFVNLDPLNVHIHRHMFNIWMLLGDEEGKLFKDAYSKSKNYFVSNAVLNDNQFLFVPEMKSSGDRNFIMHQSACAWPAQIAIDNRIHGYNQTEIGMAKKLIETCMMMFSTAPGYVAPDLVHFDNKNVNFTTQVYSLGSEVMEGLYHMYRLTGDSYYRDSGYFIYKAIKAKCRDKYGYAPIDENGNKLDQMSPTIFNKFMKYLFLLVARDNVLRDKNLIFTPSGHIYKYT